MPYDPSIVSGVESGGNPNAKNPLSSATGLGQFIDSTWLSLLPKYRPDLTEGKSPQEILALRSDPDLSKQMIEAYGSENGQLLAQRGLPVTPGTQYLAHFAGPQGAVSVLSADPSALVSSVLTPGAMAANPFLKNMTVADLRAWSDRKMGGQAAPQQPQMAGGAPMPPQVNPAQQAMPAFPFSPGAQGTQPQAQYQPQAEAQMPAPEAPAFRFDPYLLDPDRINPMTKKIALSALPFRRGFSFRT